MHATSACRHVSNALIPACGNQMYRRGSNVCSYFTIVLTFVPWLRSLWPETASLPRTSVECVQTFVSNAVKNVECLKTHIARHVLMNAINVPRNAAIWRKCSISCPLRGKKPGWVLPILSLCKDRSLPFDGDKKFIMANNNLQGIL